jgi:hypothetical protein
MAEPKTRPNDGDVDAFLASVGDDRRRRDAMAMRDIMARLSGDEPTMWGDSIVGFGEYQSTSGSGTKVTWMRTGFAPRKQALTLYIMDGFDDYANLLGRLGPHSTGRACLYIKDLDKVDREVLEQIISMSLDHVSRRTEDATD